MFDIWDETTGRVNCRLRRPDSLSQHLTTFSSYLLPHYLEGTRNSCSIFFLERCLFLSLYKYFLVRFFFISRIQIHFLKKKNIVKENARFIVKNVHIRQGEVPYRQLRWRYHWYCHHYYWNSISPCLNISSTVFIPSCTCNDFNTTPGYYVPITMGWYQLTVWLPFFPLRETTVVDE